MQEVVVNSWQEAFRLSERAHERLRELGGSSKPPRDDPVLVQVVRELGRAGASGQGAWLRIVGVPDGVEWFIVEHDGREHVRERHGRRKWS